MKKEASSESSPARNNLVSEHRKLTSPLKHIETLFKNLCRVSDFRWLRGAFCLKGLMTEEDVK